MRLVSESSENDEVHRDFIASIKPPEFLDEGSDDSCSEGEKREGDNNPLGGSIRKVMKIIQKVPQRIADNPSSLPFVHPGAPPRSFGGLERP